MDPRSSTAIIPLTPTPEGTSGGCLSHCSCCVQPGHVSATLVRQRRGSSNTRSWNRQICISAIQCINQRQKVDLKQQIPMDHTFSPILIPDPVDVQSRFPGHHGVNRGLPLISLGFPVIPLFASNARSLINNLPAHTDVSAQPWNSPGLKPWHSEDLLTKALHKCQCHNHTQSHHEAHSWTWDQPAV